MRTIDFNVTKIEAKENRTPVAMEIIPCVNERYERRKLESEIIERDTKANVYRRRNKFKSELVEILGSLAIVCLITSIFAAYFMFC